MTSHRCLIQNNSFSFDAVARWKKNKSNLKKHLRQFTAISLALSLGVLPSAAWASCPTSISGDTTISGSLTCDYTWTGGNITMHGPIDLTIFSPYGDDVLQTSSLSSGNLTIDASVSIDTTKSVDDFLDNGTGNNINSITNNGTVLAYYDIDNAGSINTITNNGTFGEIMNAPPGTIGTITNAAEATLGGNWYPGIFNVGTITTIYNYGTMTDGETGLGIMNSGTIGTLVNGQNNLIFGGGREEKTGGGSNLPQNYITYFSSPTTYGKVTFNALSSYALTNYGVAWGSGVHLLAGATYTDVISSDQALTVPTNEISLNGSTYHLVAESGADLAYDLVVDSFTTTNPATGVSSAVSQQGNNPAYNAARVIDANSTLSNLFTNLSGNQAISNAASQTLPLLTGGQSLALANALHGVDHIIQARQEGEEGLSTGESVGDKYFWVKPFGSWSSQDDHNGVSGYSAKTYGSVFGGDAKVAGHDRLGVAFAYARSDISSNSDIAPQNSTIDSYQGIFYGSHSLDAATEFNYQVDVGGHENNGSRDIALTNQVAQSDYASWSGHIGGGLGHILRMDDNTSVTPSARADYTIIHNDGYSESGASALDLNVNGATAQELIPGIDVKVAHDLIENIELTANLGGGYDVLNEKASITSAFAGAPSASFVTTGIAPSPWIGRGGAALVSKLDDTTEIGVHYDFEVRDGYNNQTASVKMRWTF